MQVQFKLTVGENEFTLVETIESHTDFFKKMSFYSTLPKVGPNGETDLVIQHRVAQKQYDYYSIVSKKANMEFKFGQSKDAKGTLFAKGWEPLFQGDGSEEGEDAYQGSAGLGAPQAGASVGLGAPTAAAPAAAPKAATAGLGLGALKTPTPAPAPAAAQPAPAAASPAVQQNAQNILSKFGI